MSIASPARLESRETRIVESLGGSTRVDREAGVIRNVKLVGFQSKNGRVYPPSALKAAVHLYEGAKVNVDHPEADNPGRQRKYCERLGVIRAARFTEGQGNFGDFHFNPKHPLAEQLIWDAENSPESLGFSHNATLRLGPINNQGKQVIESIVSIRSMDLVADPATTTSLFESQDMTMDDPAAMAPAETDPSTAVKGAFKQMVIAAFDDESLDDKATIKKIGEILKAQAKLMGVSEKPEEPASDEPAETPGEEGVAFQKQIADLKQALESYKAKEREAAMVESINTELATAGLDPKNTRHVSELFSKQLLATESVDERKALIADRASLVGAVARTESHSTPVYVPGTTDATESIDTRTIASRLLS